MPGGSQDAGPGRVSALDGCSMGILRVEGRVPPQDRGEQRL